MMRRAFQFPYFTKYYNCISISRKNVIKNQIKRIHSTVNVNVKMYIENENKYAYEVMQNIGYINVLNIEKQNVEQMTNEEFESIQSRNWSKEPPHVLFKKLSSLGMYCSQNNICISNKVFDDYVDNLTDKIKFATDEELKTLFHSLSQFPATVSIKTRNYIEIWAALDDECFHRINKWSNDEMLTFLSLFYMLNVIRASDYSYKCLLKLAYRAKQLTKSQVVQTYFFIGTARKSPKDMHNLEIYVQDQFSQFSIDDLAIIAMGLFKSKTPIRNMVLISNIIDKIKKNSKHIHEVSLASLLKVIRYSMKITADNKIYELLESLQYEIPRLSIMCNVHLALVGTSTLVLHKNCLGKIAEKMQTSMSNARLKDFERIVLTYGTFNFIPQTKTCFFSQILDELRKPDRIEEINKHGRSFACCVAYFGLLGIYPQDLMNRILCKEFLENTYGKNCHQFGREILSIHNTAKIFLKHENMNLLNDSHVTILSKKYTDYIPSESYQKAYNISEKMFLDVKRVLQLMRGEDFVTGHHIVTHHQRGDIIICNDQEGKPLPVTTAFSKSKFGLLCSPPDENIWTVLIIAGRNTMIHNSSSASGQFTSKVRELKTLGYNAVLVMWNVYDKLTNNEEKINYLNRLIEDSISKN